MNQMTDAGLLLHRCIQKVASGKKTSKNLGYEEAKEALRYIVCAQVHPVQAAVLLIALRMKGETQQELKGALDALIGLSTCLRVDCERLLQIADPFDGFKRQHALSAFLPALLAACGQPCVAVGAVDMPPKHGVSHEAVLSRLGYGTPNSLEEAKRRLEHAGWAYVPQRLYSPYLAQLKELRTLLVKRCCLTTVEGAVRPFEAKINHWVKGFVHSGYDQLYADLAQAAGYEQALLLKGREGGVMPTFAKPLKLSRYRSGQGVSLWSPTIEREPHLSFSQDPAQGPACAQRSAELGLAVLQGSRSEQRMALVQSSALILLAQGEGRLWHSSRMAVEQAIDSGRALQQFEKGCSP